LYRIVKMKRKYARKIAEWKYGDEYAYCDFLGWKREKKELLCGLYFAVLEGDDLAGFMSFGASAQWPSESMRKFYDDETYTDVAMGLEPSRCGKGLGRDFCNACCDFAKEMFPDDKIRLSVDARNARARALYEAIGFKLEHCEKFDDREDILIYVEK
jgi:RimJ/RimL family protein N-acetyltransferase